VGLDRLIVALDNALKSLTIGAPHSGRPSPSADLPDASLTDSERRHAAGLMRVNHAGEIAAQGLYQGQAFVAREAELRSLLLNAAREEADHLQWTQGRLDQLGARSSVFNPLWYAGAFALGLAAGCLGRKKSLAFLVETERQVEAHLTGHLTRLPQADTASRAILEKMSSDEKEHGESAARAGAESLPEWVQAAMKRSAKVMTQTAYFL